MEANKQNALAELAVNELNEKVKRASQVEFIDPAFDSDNLSFRLFDSQKGDTGVHVIGPGLTKPQMITMNDTVVFAKKLPKIGRESEYDCHILCDELGIPHLVPVLSTQGVGDFADDGGYYVTLRENIVPLSEIDPSIISPEAVKVIGKKVCDYLSLIHQHGGRHGDPKPKNIGIDAMVGTLESAGKMDGIFLYDFEYGEANKSRKQISNSLHNKEITAWINNLSEYVGNNSPEIIDLLNQMKAEYTW
jgi:serine/threonine protein kinase